MRKPLFEVTVPGVEPLHRGKVRSVYAAGDDLVIVASDRISAYDVILPTAIPDKGRTLTQLSAFWFEHLAAAAPHHCLSFNLEEFPAPFRDVPGLAGCSMLCRRAEPVKAECIVRGYLAGSGWREYRDHGTLNGEPLPAGLEQGSPLDPIRFTPSTKAEEGHDEPMTWDEFRRQLGDDLAQELRQRSIDIFRQATLYCEQAGMILVDTKFEFGRVGDDVMLIDECLSPDSSRFWDAGEYAKGNLQAYDKQFVRDYLDSIGWDHTPPAPELTADVVTATRERYVEALRRIVGDAGIRPAGLDAMGVL
jgi:phosphoribosylaminoimidazole-succinocarboxamide synthase